MIENENYIKQCKEIESMKQPFLITHQWNILKNRYLDPWIDRVPSPLNEALLRETNGTYALKAFCLGRGVP